MESGGNKTVNVLILDDEDCVCRAVRRRLIDRVGAVFTANVPQEAQAILAAYPITVFVTDYDLGLTVIRGPKFVEIMRWVYPEIKRAAVFSGSSDAIADGFPSIDAVFDKGGGIGGLISFVCGR